MVARRRHAVAARLVHTAPPFVAVLPTSVLTGDCYFLTFSLVHRTFAMFVSLELSLIFINREEPGSDVSVNSTMDTDKENELNEDEDGR